MSERPSGSHVTQRVLRRTAENSDRVRLELEIPSDVACIEEVIETVRRECSAFDFPDRQCSLNVPVALAEALSNAILRGNEEDPEKSVRVRMCLDRRELVLEVRDEGEGFDMQECMVDPTLPEERLREDGRGLFLMRALMDRVERFDDGGNVVRLTLRRP